MAYTFENPTGTPAYIVTLDDNFDMQADMSTMFSELLTQLETQAQTISIILVLRTKRFSLDNLFNATKLLRDADSLPFNHANCEQVIVVTDKTIMRKSMEGFRKFGFIKAFHAVETLDEALTLV